MTGPSTRFGGPEQSPGFLLWRVTLAWQRMMRSVLAPHDLTHVQFVLLASLWWLESREDQPCTQARLADQAGADQMMTSQVIRKLEGRRLLDRTFDPGDGRARRVQLTDAGRQLVAAALADVERADVRYFSDLGPERDALVRMLATLSAAEHS